MAESKFKGMFYIPTNGRVKYTYYIEAEDTLGESQGARLWTRVDSFGMWTHGGEAKRFFKDLRDSIALERRSTMEWLLFMGLSGHENFRISREDVKDERAMDAMASNMPVS